MGTLIVRLPWPPSANRYWRRVGNKTLISREGRRYREAVFSAVAAQGAALGFDGRLRVHVTAYPPDRRRRDLDNLHKAILDGLEFAGVYEDDSQIDDLRIVRGERVDGGLIEVEIEEVW